MIISDHHMRAGVLIPLALAGLALIAYAQEGSLNPFNQTPLPRVVLEHPAIKQMQREMEELKRENQRLREQINPSLPATPAPSTLPLTEDSLFDHEGLLRARYSEAMLIIEGDESVGTGFIASVDFKHYLYTAAHVLTGNRRFTIRNCSGTRFTKFGPLETAEGADLVRLELLEPSSAFKLADPDSGTRIQTQIAALGNGGGAGVVAIEKGTVIGTSGDLLEVDAKIIKGNSGGPVICIATGNAIGVVTHLTAARQDMWSAGTRQGEIRRFACRIDRDWQWKPIPIIDFLANGQTVKDYDSLTRLCSALTTLSPTPAGLRLIQDVKNHPTFAIIGENESHPIVRSLYSLNTTLADRKIGTSEADLKRQFVSVLAQAKGYAMRSAPPPDRSRYAWFHRSTLEDSMKAREDAIARLTTQMDRLSH